MLKNDDENFKGHTSVVNTGKFINLCVLFNWNRFDLQALCKCKVCIIKFWIFPKDSTGKSNIMRKLNKKSEYISLRDEIDLPYFLFYWK